MILDFVSLLARKPDECERCCSIIDIFRDRFTALSFRRLACWVLCLALATPVFASDVVYEYDAYGRLSKATYDGGAGAVVNYYYDNNGNRTSAVTSNVTRGTLSLGSTSYSGGEASGSRIVSVSVQRGGGSFGPARVNYATANGTAVTTGTGGDYVATSGTLSWGSGDSTAKTFTITILDDSIVESTENFTLALSSPVGAALGTASATVSIVDNDVDTTAPGAPGTPVISSITGTTATATWTAATDLVGVTGYQYRLNAGSWTTLGNVLTVSLTALTNGTSYTFDVRARDAAGNWGTPSSKTFATPDTSAPTTPGTPTITVTSSTQLNLSWTASTDNKGVTGYKVERCTGASCTNFAQIATSTTNSYSDTGRSPSTTYRYQIRSNDAAGNNSSYSAIASKATTADTTAPSVPASLTATTSSSTQINLSWSASTDSGGSGLTGYKIERCQGVGCTSFSQIATTITNSYSDSGRSAATTYVYRVRAYDVAGNNSGYSNSSSVATPSDATAPSVPSSLVATAAASSQVNLTWVVSTDTGGSGLTGYKVERCQGAGCSNFSQIATPTTNSYSDTGRAPTTTYLYRVRAYDGAGNNSSYSGTATATTPADTTAPSTPSSPSATATSSTQIDLSWAASTDTGGSGLTGYKVERCQGVGCTSFGQIATPATNSYSDTGRAPTTTYLYRIRAYDAVGNNSAYSTTTSAATPADTTAPSIPTGLTVNTASSQQLNISWGVATDAGGSGLAGYKLERCQNAGCANFATVATLSTTGYSDTGLSPSTTYVYRVRAYDVANNNSGYSAGVNGATAADTQPPTAPTALGISGVSCAQVALSWAGSTDAGGSGLSGYKVERCAGASCSSFAQIGTTSSTGYPDGAVASSTSYSYIVRAYDVAGNNSSYSGAVSATTPDCTPPSTPPGLAISGIHATSASASWGASSDNVGVVAYDYQLNGGSWQSNGTALGVTLSGLTVNTPYTVNVRARDLAGNTSVAATQSFTTVDDVPPGPPGAPSFSSITLSSVTASWTAASDNVGVSGYQYRVNGGSWVDVGAAQSVGITGLTAVTQYTVEVQARDAAGYTSSVSANSFSTLSPTITLPSSDGGSVSGQGTVSAIYTLLSSGAIYKPTSSGGQQYEGDWLSPVVATNKFQVMASGQSSTCIGTFNTWTSVDQIWKVKAPSNGGGFASCGFQVTIKNTVTGATATSNITLSAYNSSPPF